MSRGVTTKRAKKVRLQTPKSARRGAGDIQKLNSNLNIQLGPEQITEIVRTVVGTKGQMASDLFGQIGDVALNGGACCVDASVGSSVIGPASSVGSSVSVVDKVRDVGSRVGRLQKIKADFAAQNVTITIPSKVTIK